MSLILTGVRPDSPLTLAGDPLMQWLMNLYVLPEVERRQRAGRATRPFPLRAVQVVFSPDERGPLVRLNEEVKCIAGVALKNGVRKIKGDTVFSTEVAGLRTVELSHQDDPDCGHATALLLDDKWYVSFDFRRNKALASHHVARANEFFATAMLAFSNQHLAPALDALYSAAELAAKAVLLLSPDNSALKKSKKHRFVLSRYNAFAKLGYAQPECRSTLNRLAELRPEARYPGKSRELLATDKEVDELSRAVRSMIDDAGARIA